MIKLNKKIACCLGIFVFVLVAFLTSRPYTVQALDFECAGNELCVWNGADIWDFCALNPDATFMCTCDEGGYCGTSPGEFCGSGPEIEGVTYDYCVPPDDCVCDDVPPPPPPPVQGAYQGVYQGVYQGAYQGSYQGSYQGGYEGSYEGSYEASGQGSYEGSYQGSYQGAYEGSYQGAYAPGSYSISGYVYRDLNTTCYCAPGGVKDAGEPGLAGETVTLSNVAVTIIYGTTVTDGNGRYSFSNVAPGDYRITHVVPAGYIRTTDDSTTRTVTNANVAYDFGLYMTPKTISGYVYTDLNTSTCCGGVKNVGEAGMAGRSVVLQNNAGTITYQTVVTDGAGFYTMVADPGDYRISHAIPAGYVRTTDDSRTFTLSTANFAHDFGLFGQPPPPTPTITSVSNATCTRLIVNWGDVAGETGYTVWRATNAGGPYVNASGNLPANTITYMDTPPIVGAAYYYQVRAYINYPPVVEATSPTAGPVVNLACAPNFSNSTLRIFEVNGNPYNSTTPINNGDTITFRLTLVNSGTAATDVNFGCDSLSANLINPVNMAVAGGGADNGIIQNDAALCAGLHRLRFSGNIPTATNWTITYDTTFQSSTTNAFEVCSNDIGVRYNVQTQTHTVSMPKFLCKTGNSTAPNFQEVNP